MSDERCFDILGMKPLDIFNKESQHFPAMFAPTDPPKRAMVSFPNPDRKVFALKNP